MAKKLKPMHPGEVLREEFLSPLGMSAGALARACGIPRTRIERIANGQTGITADTALRLGKALNTTPQLWLNLQNDYDVQVAKRDLGKVLDTIETVNKPKAAWTRAARVSVPQPTTPCRSSSARTVLRTSRSRSIGLPR